MTSLAPAATEAIRERASVAIALGLGTAVALSLAVAATHAAGVTVASPITPEGAWRGIFVVGVALAFGLFLVGLLVAHRIPPSARAAYSVAALVQLVPLAGPLLLSRDTYIYWDYGRLAAVHELNPYVHPPSAVPSDPAYELVGNDWRGTISAYGPLFVGVAQAHAAVAGESPEVAAWLYKALAAGSALALVALAGSLGRRSAFSIAFVGWNPLLALHLAGGGHNDALLMTLVLAAMLLARRGHPNLGAALWPAAIAVKWLPLILLPLHVLGERRGRRFGWPGFLGGALIVGGASFLLFGHHWWRAAVPISNQLQRASSISIPHWISQTGVSWRTAAAVLTALFGVAYLALLVQAARGRPRLALASALLPFSLAWIVPWYATWSVSLAAVEEDRLARILALAWSAYLLRDAIPL